jgi:hypothetical protein
VNDQAPIALDKAAEGALTEYLGPRVSPALQIFLNDQLFDRCTQVAIRLSDAKGFVPDHLVGNKAACFAVVVQSIVWRLSPYAVAACTYETPGGRIGYEGKLVQAVLEASGQLEGGITFVHYGDWNKIKGNFAIEKKKNRNGYENEVPVARWSPDDEIGVGVTVSAHLKKETAPRTLNFDLRTAFPRNSTLWSLRPEQQICYAAVRAFANMVMPGLLLGVPIEGDEIFLDTSNMRDVTPPRPTREPQPDKAAAETAAKAEAPETEEDQREIDRKIRQAQGQDLGDEEPEAAQDEARPKAEEEERIKAEEERRRAEQAKREAEERARAERAKAEQAKADQAAAARQPEADPPPPDDQGGDEAQVFDPKKEFELMRRAIVNVGPDIAKWKEFVSGSAERRRMLKTLAPALHSRLDAEIRAKEAALRAK